MFSKLLKHEWKANAGLLGILSACALGVGLLGALVLKGIIFMSERLEEADVAVLGITGLSSALMFLCVALVVYFFAVQFINLFRFYKNKFTDEGYLTFTLPVSAPQIFLSSFLNILAWLVISVLVVTAAVCMIVFIGAAGPLKEYNVEIGDYFQQMFGYMDELATDPGYPSYSVLIRISGLIAPLYTLVALMSSITVGSVLAKKHKILATIGIYYCVNFAVGTVESVLTVVMSILLGGIYYDQYYIYMSVTEVISIIMQIALSIGGYFLSTHLMKHKLNLP